MQEKRSKGLCFLCDDKFGLDHRCKKELRILWVLDEEELTGEGEVASFQDSEKGGTPNNHEDQFEDSSPFSPSLSSMVGLLAPHSLKIRRQIRDQEVVILIDSRASHNFIVAALVEELGLSTASTKEFGVMLGTGAEIRATGVCKQVNLSLIELEIIADFFPIMLGSSEVILGYHWLASLGESHRN